MVEPTVLRTACGLRVLPGESPRQWQPFSWVQEVEDLAGTMEDDVALMLIRAELTSDAASTGDWDEWTMPLDLAFASLHDGDVPRVDNPRLDNADPAISAEEANCDWRNLKPYTICGIIEGTWRSVCHQKLAPNEAVAYLWTWRNFNERGEYMLLAGVHEGQVAAINQFRYADGGSSLTAVQMEARDLWGVREN